MPTPQHSPSRPRAALYLIGATLFWAGNYVIGETAVKSIPPLTLVYLRWLIACVPLLLIARTFERPRWRVLLPHWPHLLVLALLGVFGYTFLLYEALRHTSALNASLINAFNPALIALAAAVFLRERVGPRGVLGLILALFGVILVLTGGRPLMLLSVTYNRGDLFMLAAIAAWTAYTILVRQLRGLPPIASTAIQCVLTVLVLTPIIVFWGDLHLPPTRAAALSLLYIAIFPSVLSYLLWNSALVAIDASRAAVFMNLITVFTAAASLALGRPVTVPQIVGGVLVLTGVIVTTTSAARARRP